MVPMARKPRVQLPTMLVVGEGYAEMALLAHIKSLYAPRSAGLKLTIHNARGKGAAHVIDVAIRQARAYSFDHIWAVLDKATSFL
jgi:hypothetical protein